MKTPRMEVVFFFDKSKKPGYGTIYCRISMNGVRAEIGTTGIRIPREDWGESEVLETNPHCMQYNEKLVAIKSQLLAVYNQFFLAGKPFSVHQVKMKYENKGEYTELIQALDAWLKTIGKRRDLTNSTKESYGFSVAKVKDFLIDSRLQRLGLQEFDEGRFIQLREWLTSTKKHEKSYVRRVLTVTKQAVHWAYTKKLCESYELDGVKVKKPRPKDPIFLTVEQFEDLRRPFRNEAMQRVADVLVVYCRTGFHYNDLRLLAQHADEEVLRGLDGERWIYHERIKTDVKAKVPLWCEVEQVVAKYGGWERLPILSNQQMNKWLKLIAADRGWPEPVASQISVKIGRKTLTDWLLNVQCWSEESVKVVLGLKSTDSLEPYGRADERRVIEEMKRGSSENQSKKAS